MIKCNTVLMDEFLSITFCREVKMQWLNKELQKVKDLRGKGTTVKKGKGLHSAVDTLLYCTE